MALKSKIIVHNTQINLDLLFFWVKNCPKVEEENLSKILKKRFWPKWSFVKSIKGLPQKEQTFNRWFESRVILCCSGLHRGRYPDI
jgi:hypothetical protein